MALTQLSAIAIHVNAMPLEFVYVRQFIVRMIGDAGMNDRPDKKELEAALTWAERWNFDNSLRSRRIKMFAAEIRALQQLLAAHPDYGAIVKITKEMVDGN